MVFDRLTRRGAVLIVVLGLAGGAWRAEGFSGRAGIQDPVEDVPSMDTNDVPGNTPLGAVGSDSSPLSPRLSFRVEPEVIITGRPTTVRFQVYSYSPEPSARLTVESVDANGRGIATEANLFDDGTHGDTKAADKTYTVEKRFGPLNIGQARFRVRLVEDGKTEVSRVIAVPVVDNNSDQGQFATVGAINSAAQAEYGRLRKTMVPEQAVQGLLEWIRQQPLVVSAEIGPERFTIVVYYRNGLRSTLYLRD